MTDDPNTRYNMDQKIKEWREIKLYPKKLKGTQSNDLAPKRVLNVSEGSGHGLKKQTVI